jgi:hypothetical protein
MPTAATAANRCILTGIVLRTAFDVAVALRPKEASLCAPRLSWDGSPSVRAAGRRRRPHGCGSPLRGRPGDAKSAESGSGPLSSVEVLVTS